MSARSYTLKPISSNSNEISPIRTEWKLNCASRPTMSEYLTTPHPPKIHLEEFREKVIFFKKKKFNLNVRYRIPSYPLFSNISLVLQL